MQVKKLSGLTFFTVLTLYIVHASYALAEAIINTAPINVIGSSLSLSNEDNIFNIPALESEARFSKDTGYLSNDLYSFTKKIPSLQISGGPRRLAESFTLRGFDKNGISVLVDDIPVAFLSQHINNLFIGANEVESIKVIRGPFSSLYGNNAMGGVVSFTTFDANDFLKGNKTYGATYGIGGGSGNKEITSYIRGYAKGEYSNFLASFSTSRRGKISSGNQGEVKIPEQDTVYNGLMKTSLSLSDDQNVQINFYFNQVNSKLPANPEQSDASIMNINHKINSNNYIVRVAHNYISDNNIPNLKTVIYYNYGTEEEIPQSTLQGMYNEGQKLGKTNNYFGFKHQESFTFLINNTLNSSLVYGINYDAEMQKRSDTDPRGLIADANANNGGFFVQNELFLNKYLTASTALRYDYFNLQNKGPDTIFNPIKHTQEAVPENVIYNQLSPKASLTFKPYQPFMLYISYGRSFRAPNLNEVYASGLHFSVPHMGENNLIPNPNLKPVTADTIEGGYGLSFNNLPINGKLSFKNAFYYTSAKNYINLFVGQTTSQYVNVKKVKMQGSDLDFTYENKIFKTMVGYNFIQAVDKDTNSNLMNISAHTGSFTFEQKILDTGLSVGYNLKLQSSYHICKINNTEGNYNCQDGQMKRAGFGVNNVYINYKNNNYTFSAAINNIGDKFYYEPFSALPATGRSYNLMFTVSV